jgi:hypothetical protein
MPGIRSLKIAMALAVTIGTGGLMLSGIEARSNEIVVRGADSSGTVVAKPDERRLYSAFNQTPADGKVRKRRSGKLRNSALPAPAAVPHENSSLKKEPKDVFPFDPMGSQR